MRNFERVQVEEIERMNKASFRGRVRMVIALRTDQVFEDDIVEDVTVKMGRHRSADLMDSTTANDKHTLDGMTLYFECDLLVALNYDQGAPLGRICAALKVTPVFSDAADGLCRVKSVTVSDWTCEDAK